MLAYWSSGKVANAASRCNSKKNLQDLISLLSRFSHEIIFVSTKFSYQSTPPIHTYYILCSKILQKVFFVLVSQLGRQFFNQKFVSPTTACRHFVFRTQVYRELRFCGVRLWRPGVKLFHHNLSQTLVTLFVINRKLRRCFYRNSFTNR